MFLIFSELIFIWTPLIAYLLSAGLGQLVANLTLAPFNTWAFRTAQNTFIKHLTKRGKLLSHWVAEMAGFKTTLCREKSFTVFLHWFGSFLDTEITFPKNMDKSPNQFAIVHNRIEFLINLMKLQMVKNMSQCLQCLSTSCNWLSTCSL